MKEDTVMATIVIRIVIGVLLMIHGFAHWQITTGWGKLTADSVVLRAVGLGDSALASLGTALWVVALFSFNLAGIGVFAGQGWWRTLAISAAVVSLLVMGLFWQPSFILGAAVDVGILVALLWAHWPTPALLVFLAVGAATLFHQGWWRQLAIVAAVASLLTITLFWQLMMILGALVDGGIVVALVGTHWPSPELVGACRSRKRLNGQAPFLFYSGGIQ